MTAGLLLIIVALPMVGSVASASQHQTPRSRLRHATRNTSAAAATDAIGHNLRTSISSKVLAGPGERARTRAAKKKQVCATINSPNSSNATGASTYLELPLGIATPNFWDTASSAGSVKQCYGASAGLVEHVHVSRVKQGSKTNAPFAFTEAAYGYSSYDHSYCKPYVSPCSTAPFPIPASDFTSKSAYLATLHFAIAKPSDPMDITYDLWLEKTLSSAGPKSGDVELLITPYSTYPACNSDPKTFKDSEGQVWDLYIGCGGSDATAIHFVLTGAEQKTTAAIEVNLSQFVDETESLLPSVAVASEKLAGIEVGSEYGQCERSTCSKVTFNWTVSYLHLQTPSSSLSLIP
jgi:hypothetical protein